MPMYEYGDVFVVIKDTRTTLNWGERKQFKAGEVLIVTGVGADSGSKPATEYDVVYMQKAKKYGFGEIRALAGKALEDVTKYKFQYNIFKDNSKALV